jgi:hypothetical protein
MGHISQSHNIQRLDPTVVKDLDRTLRFPLVTAAHRAVEFLQQVLVQLRLDVPPQLVPPSLAPAMGSNTAHGKSERSS